MTTKKNFTHLWMRIEFLLALLLICAPQIIANETYIRNDVYYRVHHGYYSDDIAIAPPPEGDMPYNGCTYIPDSININGKYYQSVRQCLANSFSNASGKLILNGNIKPTCEKCLGYITTDDHYIERYFDKFKGTLILKGKIHPYLVRHLDELDSSSTIICDPEYVAEIKNYWKGKIEAISVYIKNVDINYPNAYLSMESYKQNTILSVWFNGKEIKPSDGKYIIEGVTPGNKYPVTLHYKENSGLIKEKVDYFETPKLDVDFNQCTPEAESLIFEFEVAENNIDKGISVGATVHVNDNNSLCPSTTEFVAIEYSNIKNRKDRYGKTHYYVNVPVKNLCPNTYYRSDMIIVHGNDTITSKMTDKSKTQQLSLIPTYKSRTQRTYELLGIETDNKDVSLEGWNIYVLEDKGSKKPYIGYKKSGLRAGQEETLNLLFEKGDKQFKGEIIVNTIGLGLKIITKNISPSSVNVIATWVGMDAGKCITDIELCCDGKTINSKEAILTGLTPEKTYYIDLRATIDYGEKYNSTEKVLESFTTPKLEIKCEVPRNVNPTTSILAAQTNLADCETGVGFEWKKYDAPASLAPSSGYGILYDGRLEGRVLNLQSDKYYNCRAFYEDADKDRYYSDWVTFDPSDFSYFDPVIHSYDVSEITATSACLNGMMMPGSDEVLSQGFEIRRADSGKTVSLYSRMSDIVETIFTQGLRFKATAANLEPSTTYIYRSFVKTSRETYYGEEVTFTTIAPTSGIEDVNMTEPEREIVAYYNLQGYRIEKPSTGIVIVKYSDGSTSKILIKD